MNNRILNTDDDGYVPTIKNLFSKKYGNITDIIKSLIYPGISLTESDFGIFCSRNEKNLNILFATRNPIFQTGDIFDINYFLRNNILLNSLNTFTSEAHHQFHIDSQIFSSQSNTLFYISSPIILFDKLFGYIIFFKNNNSYYKEEESVVDNLSSFISIQIEKLIKREKNIADDFAIEDSLKSDVNPAEPVFYLYNIKNNKYYFPVKNLFNELGYSDYNSEISLKEIIHPEDIFNFKSRNNKLASLSMKDVYEMNLHLKDSTGKWRLFCQRDIVYSIDNSGNPEKILSIINELDSEISEIEQNKFKSYINETSNFKNYLDMDSEMTEILDMNIIQNLRDLGGENDTTFLKEVIDLYLDQAPGLMNDIKNAARDKNPLKLSQSAHALKGASLNIGAKKFSDVCKGLEFKGKDNNLEDVNILLTELDESYLITANELKKLVK